MPVLKEKASFFPVGTKPFTAMSLFSLIALAALFQPHPPAPALASVLRRFLSSLLSDPCVQVSVPPQVPRAYKTNKPSSPFKCLCSSSTSFDHRISWFCCSCLQLGFSSAFHLYHVLALASTWAGLWCIIPTPHRQGQWSRLRFPAPWPPAEIPRASATLQFLARFLPLLSIIISIWLLFLCFPLNASSCQDSPVTSH